MHCEWIAFQSSGEEFLSAVELSRDPCKRGTRNLQANFDLHHSAIF
jgi:hypothetical protein